jgi:hypothetical protein
MGEEREIPMQGNVRWIAFGVVALVVAGFLYVVAPRTMPGAAIAERRQAEQIARGKVIDCTLNPAFEKFRGFGADWQFLRNSSDGDKIDFNPFSIVCNPATGERDVWVQITHRHADTKTVEDATTIQTINFTRERYQYRIDCVGKRFALLQQQWMGDAPDDVAHSARMTTGVAGDLRTIEAGGVSDALLGPTCSTGRL